MVAFKGSSAAVVFSETWSMEHQLNSVLPCFQLTEMTSVQGKEWHTM